METDLVKSNALDSHTATEHLLVDIVAAPDEILASNTRRTRCCFCGDLFRDYGACKAHEFLQHAVLSEDNTDTHELPAKVAESRSVTCRQEVRYYCPTEGCRFALSHSVNSSPSGKTGKFFREMRYLKEHYLRQHSEKLFQCRNCDMKCRSEKELNLHQTSCKENVCFCGKLIKTRAGFFKHVRKCFKHSAVPGGLIEKPVQADVCLKKPRVESPSPTGSKPIQPKLPKPMWLLPGLKTFKEFKEFKEFKDVPTLSINSCVQTTESLLSRPKNNHASTGAQCYINTIKNTAKTNNNNNNKYNNNNNYDNCNNNNNNNNNNSNNNNNNCNNNSTNNYNNKIVQTGIDYGNVIYDIRSSGAQTNALLEKPTVGLLIDVYTQTDSLNDNYTGFSSQEASALFQYLQPEEGSLCPGIQTQTIESELAPFFLPSNSTETQTFEDFYSLTASASHSFLSPAFPTESQTDIGSDIGSDIGTQTSAYVDCLIDQFVQESVDMQTQTLENLDDNFVWEFSDADTQTSGLRDFLQMSEF